MSQDAQQKKWEAMLRGQVIGATVNKFAIILRMIDQKAQVMIFLNSILIPVCIRAIEEGAFVEASKISITAAVLSILSAMICIYPKRKYRKSGDRRLNLLHFNDIGHLAEEDYLDRISQVLNDPAKLSATAAYDLYDTARFSIIPKFFWLKISYATFTIGNLLAIVVALYGMKIA
ncbi:MAG: hypothetical protein IPH06_06770 [Alphaproteobacteria bacterium]|jgi:hypothetical protein|nr:hypothetical protein [Alphaproteobacteria bacterium]QQS57718.1 MAG: hypothetical protein IPN28_02535 [Alphaproteobacteria bacterium]